MNAAIGKLLTQFDASGRVRPPAERPKPAEQFARPMEARREPAPAPQPVPMPAPQAEASPVNLLDEAYRRGYSTGVSEGNASLAEERVRSAIRLGEERAKWSDQQAAVIVNGFAAACRELESNIASSVARILQPFLADAVRDKAVAALVEQIAALTSSSPVPVFKISGPGDLLERVKAQLDAAQRTGIDYQATDTVEIRVVADQTVIETQLSAWIERLNEARR
ncbi:hypothetical protein [Bradyrhizobium sp. CCBAU 51753]|uniref:hypothetical protein n=1 Tax=Bradyrhizobium sp. CCBAU 51753 TaxID=1325100 RepID=UPI00188A505F|nr:hypothetical protein [Bradyrhizobium sp. CCBAU 51753]QOZ28788.1 hypothetical protein XH93_38465 [Bradyrhizobium sp. CCBAU 51753]